jgi:hypothetical protein
MGCGIMKLKKLQMSGQAIMTILSNPDHAYQVTQHHLPKDSRVIDIVRDSLRQCYWMAIESDEFPEVPEGSEPEELPAPTIRGFKVKKLDDHFEGLIVSG